MYSTRPNTDDSFMQSLLAISSSNMLQAFEVKTEKQASAQIIARQATASPFVVRIGGWSLINAPP